MRQFVAVVLGLLLAVRLMAAVFCSSCGAKFEAEVKFCSTCGGAIAAAVAPGGAAPGAGAVLRLRPEDALVREFLSGMKAGKGLKHLISNKGIGLVGAEKYVYIPAFVAEYQVTRKWVEKSTAENPKFAYKVRLQMQTEAKELRWWVGDLRVETKPEPRVLLFRDQEQGLVRTKNLLGEEEIDSSWYTWPGAVEVDDSPRPELPSRPQGEAEVRPECDPASWAGLGLQERKRRQAACK